MDLINTFSRSDVANNGLSRCKLISAARQLNLPLKFVQILSCHVHDMTVLQVKRFDVRIDAQRTNVYGDAA